MLRSVTQNWCLTVFAFIVKRFRLFVRRFTRPAMLFISRVGTAGGARGVGYVRGGDGWVMQFIGAAMSLGWK
jgi:hypothetical protein